MSVHARLSASAAHRWVACPGSIRLCDGLPSRSSEYAAEGTAAHSLAEQCLRGGQDAAEFVDRSIEADGYTFTVSEEMAEAVQVYLDYARLIMARPGVEWDLEQRFDVLQKLHPSLGGTGDFVAYDPASKCLEVIDYKHGRGVAVDPVENPQLMVYGIGAALRAHNRGLDKVRITVVQPRCPHGGGPVRTWEIDAVGLFEFASDVTDAARATEDPKAPLVPGEHCKFCPAAATCPALRGQALGAAQAEFSPVNEVIAVADPKTYDATRLAKSLAEVDLVEDWCRRVREFAHHEAEAGRCPPGYKLVGTRPTRKWKDPDSARDYLTTVLEVESEHLHAEPKMRSPAQMEAALKQHYGLKGKKATEAIAGLVIKESSGTVLAPADDPREPVRPEAAREFAPLADTPLEKRSTDELLEIPEFLRRK